MNTANIKIARTAAFDAWNCAETSWDALGVKQFGKKWGDIRYTETGKTGPLAGVYSRYQQARTRYYETRDEKR